jgi:hypothetical protein
MVDNGLKSELEHKEELEKLRKFFFLGNQSVFIYPNPDSMTMNGFM